MNVKHWLKIDHISFLLIAPSILLNYQSVALVLWSIALVYDFYETVAEKE